jgi:hypothetical protein
MSEVLPKAGKKVVIDEKARGILPLMQLGGAASQEQKP